MNNTEARSSVFDEIAVASASVGPLRDDERNDGDDFAWARRIVDEMEMLYADDRDSIRAHLLTIAAIAASAIQNLGTNGAVYKSLPINWDAINRGHLSEGCPGLTSS